MTEWREGEGRSVCKGHLACGRVGAVRDVGEEPLHDQASVAAASQQIAESWSDEPYQVQQSTRSFPPVLHLAAPAWTPSAHAT